MHVALIHDHVGGAGGGGGGVRQMLGLARGLLAQGCRVTVVCHDYDAATDIAEIGQAVEVRSVRNGEPDPLLSQSAVWRRQFRGMAAVARRVPADVDVVNAHEWLALQAGWHASRRLSVPLVWTRNDETMFERGLYPNETQIHPGSATSRLRHVVYGLPDLVAARAADAIVVLDGRNERFVRRSYRRPATIVRSGPAPHFFSPPDREQARSRLGISPDHVLAIGVGILFRHRRFEDLIDAVAQVDGDAPVAARIVGWDGFEPDYADALARRIEERGVRDRVELVRRSVAEDALRDLYAGADVFVFPNDRQTWGLAPLEAIAAGTPAIVSSGAGVYEVLEGRPGVWIVPPKRPDRIAAALSEVSRLERASLEPTRQFIRAELSAERYATRMIDVYRTALARRGRA
jgi:glycosyltransferase involved in cell wall biosynthesis